jgi:hypothetical protein
MELHDWIFSTNMNHVIELRMVVCAVPVAYTGEKSTVYGVLVTETEGKIILGSPKYR